VKVENLRPEGLDVELGDDELEAVAGGMPPAGHTKPGVYDCKNGEWKQECPL